MEETRRDRLHAPLERDWLIPALGLGALAVLVVGWTVREHRYLSADRGLGYLLGILGLGAMILLLAYPLRKRTRRARLGPVGFWFHFHMVLGVLGPALVLLHANFQLGSANSAVALGCALVVGSSGFVGRFAYARIHYGMFGSRVRFSQLRRDMEGLQSRILVDCPEIGEALAEFERWMLGGAGAAPGFTRFLGVKRRARRLARRVEQALERRGRGVGGELAAYLAAARRLARLRTYERIFSLWHAAHLPLCFLLYGAAVVHVVAVHLY